MPECVQLAVGRCSGCALTLYPERDGTCPRCTVGTLEPSRRSGSGEVWSWTVQRYAPKSPPYMSPPGEYRPFVVAYVETADGFRVEGIVDALPENVWIGRAVELVEVTHDVPRYRLADDGIE
jgi:uncharacterized OB-fold protein